MRQLISTRKLLCVAPLLLSACVHSTTEKHSPEAQQPVKGEAQLATAVAPSPSPGSHPQLPPLVPPSPKPAPVMVRVWVRSVPNHSVVFWGKKKLGDTPVELDRPRDSGPVDLIVRRVGYFPIHTRAYTFHSDTVYVKLTALADRMTLFGAKEELPPPAASPAPSPMAGSTPAPAQPVAPPAVAATPTPPG